MELLIALSLAYLIGFNISYWMLSTEIKAEGVVFTIGDRVVSLLLSLGSWATVAWCLVASWIGRIQRTGYWNKPAEVSEVVKEVKPLANAASSNGIHRPDTNTKVKA